MSKDEQIEEIVTFIEEGCTDDFCNNNPPGIGCNRCEATRLVNAGYGHIPTAIEEFADWLQHKIERHNSFTGYTSQGIKELGKEYLKEYGK